ncbi:hypothetical protein H1V43_17190 [Streptomyces sp. PSKA54]|uniref:Uncharacterized protein n=1 Tax=Streptomyces himalayensis subsp. aureolus TaxID=2758039 RepID=A0A7W2HGT6_9ACTN|nr:hypothetical protein [Streptomyces himalayensis]MBA4863084.1 hypothetical protein [Streptomyces himalayensis subsp. aureolus]
MRGPMYRNEMVGYLSMVRALDGNNVEFSVEHTLGTARAPSAVPCPVPACLARLLSSPLPTSVVRIVSIRPVPAAFPGRRVARIVAGHPTGSSATAGYAGISGLRRQLGQ